MFRKKMEPTIGKLDTLYRYARPIIYMEDELHKVTKFPHNLAKRNERKTENLRTIEMLWTFENFLWTFENAYNVIWWKWEQPLILTLYSWLMWPNLNSPLECLEFVKHDKKVLRSIETIVHLIKLQGGADNGFLLFLSIFKLFGLAEQKLTAWTEKIRCGTNVVTRWSFEPTKDEWAQFRPSTSKIPQSQGTL